MNDLGHGVLTTTAGTIVSASGDTRKIEHATFYNANSSSVTVTVYYLRSGETIASNGAFKGKKTIPPGKTWICLPLLGQVIKISASIQAVATVTGVIHYNVGGS